MDGLYMETPIKMGWFGGTPIFLKLKISDVQSWYQRNAENDHEINQLVSFNSAQTRPENPYREPTWPWKIHHFDGIYQERWWFSWAMLVSGSVCTIWCFKVLLGLRDLRRNAMISPTKSRLPQAPFWIRSFRSVFVALKRETLTSVLLKDTRPDGHNDTVTPL